MTEPQTDQDRLDEHMDSVLEHIKDWVKRINAGTHDEDSDEDGSIYDYPLEVIAENGKPYSVVITCGGPHIEVVAHGYDDARLEGYWWGTRSTRYDFGNKPLTQFLDFFIERD